jgi:hypothetical protein
VEGFVPISSGNSQTDILKMLSWGEELPLKVIELDPKTAG